MRRCDILARPPIRREVTLASPPNCSLLAANHLFFWISAVLEMLRSRLAFKPMTSFSQLGACTNVPLKMECDSSVTAAAQTEEDRDTHRI